MAPSQTDKAQRFRALHDAAGHFVIANAWDAGIGPHSRRASASRRWRVPAAHRPGCWAGATAW